MCYPKPGPRCSPHAKKDLDRIISVLVHVSDSDLKVKKELTEKAQVAYLAYEARFFSQGKDATTPDEQA